MSFLYGAPPKVVWLRAGNCTTDQVLTLIRREATAIAEFVDNAAEALLVLGIRSSRRRGWIRSTRQG